MKKYSKSYSEYRNKFYYEKKSGNVKQGVRVLTQNQYRRARKENITNTEIINAQTILHGQKEKKKVWSEYKKIRKTYSRGEALEQKGTYFGEDRYYNEGLGYHYNLSGLMNDKDALHFMISYRINSGEDKESVLSDYGY